MSRHILKIDELWFDRIVDGSKTAEVRKHDRDFQIGDDLVFIRESWDFATGRDVVPTVVEASSYLLVPNDFGDYDIAIEVDDE